MYDYLPYIATFLALVVALWYAFSSKKEPPPTRYDTFVELKIKLYYNIRNNHTGPLIMRFVLHELANGSNGSMSTEEELKHKVNEGMAMVMTEYLQPIKDEFPTISMADVIAMAGATTVELSSGPYVPMRYGRVDDLAPAKEGVAVDDNTKAISALYSKKGFSTDEIEILQGLHKFSSVYKDWLGLEEKADTMPEDQVVDRNRNYPKITKELCPSYKDEEKFQEALAKTFGKLLDMGANYDTEKGIPVFYGGDDAANHPSYWK